MYTYTARVLEKIENPLHDGRPVMNSIKVGVFLIDGDKEEQIGEYVRNYPGLYNTFYFFQKNDKDLALYSPDYTATRVLELPVCKDIGGEEPNGGGFCPVDFYVPSYIDRETVTWDDQIRRSRIHEPNPEDLLSRMGKWYPLDEKTGQRVEVEKPSYPIGPRQFYPFGFVSGCYWGDDSSWKIQYLDLSEVEKGIIKRDERFGYILLPDKSIALKGAIHVSGHLNDPADDPAHYVIIKVQQKFDLNTGKMMDMLD
jgi:hypothetical protein